MRSNLTLTWTRTIIIEQGALNVPSLKSLQRAVNRLGVYCDLRWTSQRDASGRQVVDVYDEQLKKVGTDLKFINPGRSNLLFLNGKVYVPDYGFGRPVSAYTGSPLEITAAPLALKVFDASL